MWNWVDLNWSVWLMDAVVALALGVGTVIVSIVLASKAAVRAANDARGAEKREYDRRLHEIEDAHYRVALRDLMSAVAYFTEAHKRPNNQTYTEAWARVWAARELVETTDRPYSIDLGVWIVRRLSSLEQAAASDRNGAADKTRDDVLGMIALWQDNPDQALEFINHGPVVVKRVDEADHGAQG